MFCNYCGAQNPDDANFCRSCGRQQNVTARTQAPKPVGSSGGSFPATLQDSKQPLREQMPMGPGTLQTNPLPIEKLASSPLKSPASEQVFSQSTAFLNSSVSSLTSRQHRGSLIAVCGGLLALFAFFFLPYLSLGFFGSFTGVQLASLNNQFIQGLGVLWLEPLIAAGVIGIALYPIIKYQGKETDQQVARGCAIALIALASITLVVLFIKYAADAQPPTSQSNFGVTGPSLASFYGAGMWIYFLAMLAVLVGGIVEFRSFSSKK